MTKQIQIRMINLTLAALSEASLEAPTPATLQALSFWQSALSRVVSK